MENASKALLMAATVLIGVLILTTMIVLFTTFGELGREYNARQQTKSIQQFNAQFIKYERGNLKAQDVITIVNMVKEWNSTGTNENITCDAKADYYFLMDKNNEINLISGEITYPTFKLEITEYHSSGRVKTIKIKQN